MTQDEKQYYNEKLLRPLTDEQKQILLERETIISNFSNMFMKIWKYIGIFLISLFTLGFISDYNSYLFKNGEFYLLGIPELIFSILLIDAIIYLFFIKIANLAIKQNNIEKESLISDNTKICTGTIIDKYISRTKDYNSKKYDSVYYAKILINGEISNYPLKNEYSIKINPSTYDILNIGDKAYLILYTPESPDTDYMNIITMDYFTKIL